MVNKHGYVALVCRISEDKSGRVEGVRAQERWGRAYSGRTWPGVPIVVFADNDLSASDDTYRPGFEAFREAVARGEVAHVWAVEQSRLERRELEWFRLAAELDAAGITEVHTNRDGVVRVRGIAASIKAVVNADEVRQLKKRVNDRLDENAGRGQPAGSRPFGYVHGVNACGDKTLIQVPAEVEVIRECATRFLAGWSLGNIAKDLREHGWTGPYRVKVTASGQRYTRKRADIDPVLTVDGTPLDDGGVPITRPGQITTNTVRSWLTSPTIAGRRLHRGIDLGPGNWDAILDAETASAIRNRLAAARLVTASNGEEVAVKPVRDAPARRYLLAGLGGVLVCGVCGAHLTGTLKQRRKGGRLLATVPYYACHPKNGGRGCVGVLADPVDTLVVDTLLAELDKPAFRAAMAADEYADRRHAISRELDSLEIQRNDLAAEWSAGDLNMAEWKAARHGLAEREGVLRRELISLPVPAMRADLDGLREAWQYMTLDERREIISMFIDRVAVGRARPGLHTFDPDRISPPETWWARRTR